MPRDSTDAIKIDAYNHFLPPLYVEMLKQHSKDSGIVKRMTSIHVLWDIEARLDMLRQWPEVQQVLTLGLPHPEGLGGPEISVPAARAANDGLAAACRRWPERFPAFVASLPMNDIPAALDEMDRAIGTLGARGIQIGTNILGRPLDEAEFFPVFERIANHHKLPVWMHPLSSRVSPTTAASRNRATRSGRFSAGPTRPAWRCRGSCSRGCWTGCRICASSRIIAAA